LLGASASAVCPTNTNANTIIFFIVFLLIPHQ
jgi:hypothetical protein